MEPFGYETSIFRKETSGQDAAHLLVIEGKSSVPIAECRDVGGAPTMAPGRNFPDIGRCNVPVSPFALRSANHPFESEVASAPVLVRDCSLQSMRRDRAVVRPPARRERWRGALFLHRGNARRVEGRI